MAQLHLFPGGEYVNDGERRVAEALEAELPDDWVAFANVELTYKERVDEIDILLVTPTRVLVVETKDLPGNVLIRPAEMIVNGQGRTEPYKLAHAKAKRLKSRVAHVHTDLSDLWADGFVVLARKPAMLDVDEVLKHRVSVLDHASLMLENSEWSPRVSGPLTDHADRIADALAFKPRKNKAAIGPYRVTKQLERASGEELYEAVHQETDRRVQLRRLIFDASTTKSDRELRRRAAKRAHEVTAKVDDSAHLAPVGEVFPTDDGCLVVTTPLTAALPLDEWVTTHEPDEAERRRIVADVADGLANLHRADIVHGRLCPRTIEVLPSGAARVGGLGTVHLPTSKGDTVVMPTFDPWFAPPEVLDAGRLCRESDLFSLGRLVTWLWPDSPGEHRPQPIGPPPPALVTLVDGLTVAEPSDRQPGATEVALAASLAPPVEEAAIAVATVLESGVVVEGYELVERLPGGPSTVWQAFDPMVQLPCVVKVFEGPDGLESARNQFKLLHELNGPGIVRERDVKRVGEGAILVTEMVEGTDLGSTLERDGAMAFDDALGLLHGLVVALEEVHAAGRAHGDVKPANLVRSFDRLVLVDFDLAVPPGSDVTGGTAAYLPPDVDFVADPRPRDLYAAALVFLQMVSGDVERSPEPAELDLPGPIVELLGRALAPSAGDRFRTATKLRHALEDATSALGPEVDVVEEPVDVTDEPEVAHAALLADGQLPLPPAEGTLPLLEPIAAETGGEVGPGDPAWEWEQYRPRYAARPETFDAYVDVWTTDLEVRAHYRSWSAFSRCANGESAVRHRMGPARDAMTRNGYVLEDGPHGKGARWRRS
jgi:serine/threonine protein kinase